MSLVNLNSGQLARLIELVKHKEHLQSQLSDIDAEIVALESSTSVAKKRGRKLGRPIGSGSVPAPTKRKRRGKRLKGSLLKELEAAGSGGITVKELAEKLGVKPGNIFSWFYTTGKKIKGIKKVGEAKYSYSA